LKQLLTLIAMLTLVLFMPALARADDASPPTKFTVTLTAASPNWTIEPTVSYDVFKAVDVFGKKGFDVHVWGLGAADANTGQPLGGFGIVAPFKVAGNVTIWFGPRFTVESGQDPVFGVVFGIEAIKF